MPDRMPAAVRVLPPRDHIAHLLGRLRERTHVDDDVAALAAVVDELRTRVDDLRADLAHVASAGATSAARLTQVEAVLDAHVVEPDAHPVSVR